MSWLFDTLIWTGLLIALVLLVRRPVAKHFGAKAAYALWTLPMVRLVMPPITLPAWMAPKEEPVALVSAAEFAPTDTAILFIPDNAPAAAPPFDWTPVLVAVWLLGAVAFVALRVRAYRRMRAIMLDNAIEVGREGKIRLVETPMTEAPIAFGVRDKVIALPEAFLDRTDRQTRDLALEHELSHHRGQDLLVNFLVQPLFALHWFNPLSWLGWRALRCDQEAACDARVVESRSQRERAEYAEVIAGFATGPRLALAAPMACPVLGDKSIIHRLRSLKMNDVSTRRRRAGLFGLTVAAIALPLTATMTYAEVPVPPAPPAPPAAPSAVTAPPAPPAPLAPVAPVWWQASKEFDEAMGDIDGDVTEERHVHIIKDEEHEHSGDGHTVKKVKIRKIHTEGMSVEERAELRAEMAEAMAEMRADLAEARAEHKVAMLELKDSVGDMTVIEAKCEGDEPVVHKKGNDGKKMMVICTTAITAQALNGLKQARKAISGESNIDDEMKAEILRSLDEEIAKMQSEG